MENSAEALKLAFAVIVFVMALSVSIVVFSQARSTSDLVLQFSNKANYYEYEDYQKNDKASESRIVGLESIIPTLYKYSKENYRVEFRQGTYDETTGTFTQPIENLSKLKIYESQSNRNLWAANYTGDANIYAFDLNEEIQRRETWTINSLAVKINLDKVLQGEGVYAGNPLTNKNNRYVELIGRKILTDKVNSEGGSTASNTTTTKTIITYVKIL